MSRQWRFALGLSAFLHLALIAWALGLSRRFTGPIDVEISSMRMDELKDLPLGGRASEHSTSDRPRRVDHPARPPAERVRSAKVEDRDRLEQSRPANERDALSVKSDLAAYGPKGSRLTILLRFDRLRRTNYATLVGDLLATLPSGRDLLEGTDLDLLQTVDALLLATPDPVNPGVTFPRQGPVGPGNSRRGSGRKGLLSAKRPLVPLILIASQVLNIAHTEILAPGVDRHDPSLDTRVAAEIIAEAAHMMATINRYRLALLDPDACPSDGP